MLRITIVTVALAITGACSKGDEPARQSTTSAARKLEIVAAPPNVDVAVHVREAVGKAKQDGKQLVVYVGAPWCEPCRYFHDAAIAGELDEAFGDLRLVEFDLDRDGAALERAGYKSHLVPLFALPLDDGRASGKAIEGSIKGNQAVAQIAPRLRALVSDGGR